MKDGHFHMGCLETCNTKSTEADEGSFLKKKRKSKDIKASTVED
jgi:hypothetical protein